MNEKRKMLTIVDSKGVVTQVEVVIAFKVEATNKDYVIYTKNEQDSSGNVIIYVSGVEDIDGEMKLIGIANDEEWEKIKEIIKELSKITPTE